MRHQKNKTGLRSSKSHLKALYRNLITALFEHETIKTTESRAKTISPIVNQLVTSIKSKNDREAIRLLGKYITKTEVSKKIILESKAKFQNNSGFTKIHKLGHRVGDGAKYVQIQLNY